MAQLKILPVAMLMVVASAASARENIGSGKTAIGYKSLAAACNPASAQYELSVNNVRTTLLTGGDMWWNLNDARYEIPKVDPASGAPSIHSLFAGAIWLGGIDAGGQLKIAAQTYRQSGNDFWPGPLDANASVTSDVCDEYDKFWKVTREDIEELITKVNEAGGCIPESQVPQSLLEWPAKGNTRSTGVSGNPLVIDGDLAPFWDADGNQRYNPECGDYPVINPDAPVQTYGDEMIFWVYNDKGNIHSETGGQAIGIQVNALAFAFTTSDEVNDMTFYRYKLINKATIDIKNFYMAQWVDADLGCYNDDYVGCDTTRALGICYNGDTYDEDCATRGYGDNPPLVGVDFFEGPLSDPFYDADSNLVRKQLGMSAFTYYNNDFTTTGNPETAVHYYNYMTGFWKDNTCFSRDQPDAYGGTQCTRYMFPTSPDLGPFPDYWSECSVNNVPADRRFLQSSGPFTLKPGAVNNITVGVVWARPPGAYPCPDFATALGEADDKAQALFDNHFKLVDGPDAPTLAIRELDKEIIISLVNNPGSNNINESYNEADPIAVALRGERTELVTTFTQTPASTCYHPVCPDTTVTFRSSPPSPTRDPNAYDWDTVLHTATLDICDAAAVQCDTSITTIYDTSAIRNPAANDWDTIITFEASTDRIRLIVNDSPCVTFCGVLYEFLPAAFGTVYLSNGCDSTWVYLGESSPEFSTDSSHYITSDGCPVTSYAEKVVNLWFTAGDTVIGQSSGAAAIVSASNAFGDITLVPLSGAFTDGEVIAASSSRKTVLHITYDTTYINIIADTSIFNTYPDTAFINIYQDISYINADTTVTQVTTVTNPAITDTSYKFQGYILYQLKNSTVSVQDLDDVNQARVVAQVDIKDNISKIINFEFDPSVGADIPFLKVDGNNEGIRKTFQIKEDLFATGSKVLINHKTYYFAAIAYAYNNYQTYDPSTGKGQKTLYLQGRKNYKIYSAIPHIPDSPRGGTILNSEYGDGVRITRLDGSGNGGWNLELTEASVEHILEHNFFGNIEYERGKGPISVKVYDPMKVKAANFTLSMMDTTVIDTLFIRGVKDTSYLSPHAFWKLEVVSNFGNPDVQYDTIFAEKNIANLNEQLLKDYGISISIQHVGLAGKAPNDYFPLPISDIYSGYIEANGFIGATIEFEDPENQWFTGIQDEGTFSALNWIRSGKYTGGNSDRFERFFDDHAYLQGGDRSQAVFYDPNSVFGDVLEGTWAPYGLATNWVNQQLIDPSNPKWNTPYSYGPAFPWRFKSRFLPSGPFEITENDLQNLHSVDVVLTADTKLWTRCVVVELGEDASLTEGGARKGQIRKHASWNKDGTYSQSDTGRSWFPGYAINVETGERLNVLFGEDSWLTGENGRDMIWNPTSNELGPINSSEPLFGGKHYIYIMNTRYDEGAALQQTFLNNFNKFDTVPRTTTSNPVIFTRLNDSVYSKIMWVSMAHLAEGFRLDPAPPNGTIVPSDVRIRLRVNVPYQRFVVEGGNNQGLPKYFFSTDSLQVQTQQVEVAKNACDMIRVVPNPYYAYSAYEKSQLDNKVKITNLPDNCTVTIYTLGGTRIRQFTRAIAGDVSVGGDAESDNIDNSLDWDLKNSANIPVASGVYLIYVKAEGVCEKVVKWFGVLRPTDLDTF